MGALWTIGYEGAALDQWVEALKAVGVEVVVDVRDIAVSRRRGFSKTALSARLLASGIEYVHVRELGNPREWRHALKDGTLTFDEFAPLFRDQLATLEDDVAAVAALAETRRVCLVCYEEDPAHCHRSLVAESLAASASRPMVVEHLRHACSA